MTTVYAIKDSLLIIALVLYIASKLFEHKYP